MPPYWGGYGGYSYAYRNEKSAKATREEDFALKAFDSYITTWHNGTPPKEDVIHQLLTPNMSLTAPCYRDFSKYVKAKPGWTCKQTEASATQLTKYKVKKATAYYTDVIFSMQQHIIEAKAAAAHPAISAAAATDVFDRDAATTDDNSDGAGANEQGDGAPSAGAALSSTKVKKPKGTRAPKAPKSSSRKQQTATAGDSDEELEAGAPIASAAAAGTTKAKAKNVPKRKSAQGPPAASKKRKQQNQPLVPADTAAGPPSGTPAKKKAKTAKKQ